MCGIIGYCGEQDASKILISGLNAIEYRGYDSSGIALFSDGEIKTVKSRGRVYNTEALLEREKISSHCGIGHTRWATHGIASDQNSHPHTKGKTTLVHNGIIQNYRELAERLSGEYGFLSETDSEVACALIDSFYREIKDPIAAIEAAKKELCGSYALTVIFSDRPDCIYAFRSGSPLIVGVGEEGIFLTSDINAVMPSIKEYYRLRDETAVIEKDGIRFFRNGIPCKLDHYQITRSDRETDKGDFAHFMLKEIYDEPNMLYDISNRYIRDTLPSSELNVFAEPKRIRIGGSGSSYNAALIAKYYIEKYSGIPSEALSASELEYAPLAAMQDEYVMLISSSGESADTLEALRGAKEKQIPSVSLVNSVGSAMAEESDNVLYTCAGYEAAVSSTKAYCAELALSLLLSLYIGMTSGVIEEIEVKELCQNFSECRNIIETTLEAHEEIERIAQKYKSVNSAFFVGRGIDRYLCCEGALKLRETACVDCEAYPAGEFKHAAISLVTQGVLCCVIVTERRMRPKLLANIKEIRARGGSVLLITTEDIEWQEDAYDDIIRLPVSEGINAPFAAQTAFQLFAYYSGVARDCNPDRPRNLAKTVMVE